MSASLHHSTKENRLAKEKSPYLLQHKTNPVDWYPWGPEAFQKARNENKLIFLSVGYSTCHWCHVMERESFENDDIAKLMNENYVCIKVDREERPDVDRIYMTFVQATQGSGGWPMSVFLTPDLKPVVGGTYFPPVDQYGRPGFPTVLKRISDMWHRNRSEVETQSRVLMDALQSGTVGTPNPQATLPASDVFHRCYESYAKKFDSIQGGFERAPKFPQPVNLNFLFRASLLPDAAQKMPKCRDMCYKTLDCMANGGIHDHVGFGFHRYSTDEEWHVPHFEKMLYDNAQLLVSYVEAFQLTKNPKYEQTARRIVEYISRDMTDPSGGIYSAEDADSLPTHASVHKKEGAFYAWTEKEIDDALSQTVPSNSGGNDVPLSDLFKARFNVKTKGNVHRSQDPHGELLNQNVLIVRESVETIAKVFKLSEDTVSQVLETSRKILFDIRAKRPRPHLDDKMLSAWNGLMLSGLAKAAQALQDETICAKSVDVGMFIRRYLYDERNNVLLHSIYRGEGQPSQIEYPIEGFCEDYACVIRGLLDLYETCFDPMYLIWAHDLQTKQDDLFWDEQDGGYFSSHSHDESLLLRLKEESDGAEPSPNSISLSNLLRLALIFDSVDWTAKAMKMFLVFSDRFERVPRAIPEMVSALMFHLQKPMQVVICGEMTDPAVAALVRVAQEVFMPFKCVVLMDKRNTEVLRPLVGNTEAFTSAGLSSQASAHICRHFSCGVPLTDPAELQRQLMSSVSSS